MSQNLNYFIEFYLAPQITLQITHALTPAPRYPGTPSVL